MIVSSWLTCSSEHIVRLHRVSVEWLFVVNLISYVTTTKGNQNPAFLMQYLFIQAVTKQTFILKCSILNSLGFKEASV